jgi:hypothetical protein
VSSAGSLEGCLLHSRAVPGAVLKGKAHATVSCTSPIVRRWFMLLVNGLIDGFAQGENRIRELTTPIVDLGENIL